MCGYGLALRRSLSVALLVVSLGDVDTGTLATPPHSRWHASRDTKLLGLPWQPPYQNSVHLAVAGL